MGFGKWVLGGVCAVGAVVAAPVILPAAGFAVASSAIGATSVGLSAGLGMMAASTGTVAATAAAAGVAGVAAGAAQEKKRDEAYDKGKREGYVDASEEYKNKFNGQSEVFREKEKQFKEDIGEIKKKLAEYAKKEKLTQEEIKERDKIIDEMLECIKRYEEESKGNESDVESSISEYIGDAKNWALSLRLN